MSEAVTVQKGGGGKARRLLGKRRGGGVATQLTIQLLVTPRGEYGIVARHLQRLRDVVDRQRRGRHVAPALLREVQHIVGQRGGRGPGLHGGVGGGQGGVGGGDVGGGGEGGGGGRCRRCGDVVGRDEGGGVRGGGGRRGGGGHSQGHAQPGGQTGR